jgi:glucose/mannose-6-phosphate isomerase
MEFAEELGFLKEQVLFGERIDAGKRFRNVAVAGMGGSGIVGKIFSEIYTERPVTLIDGYNVPAHLSRDTLFIAVSYSGNTEETIKAAKYAARKGCMVVTISSGGRLGEYGDQKIRIPRSDLQPRSAIGYMLMPFMKGFGLVDDAGVKEAYKVLGGLDRNNQECFAHAKRISRNKKIPIVYGAYPFSSIAYRWKTQFNENAKVISYCSSFPELNHNDTMALAETYRKDEFYIMVFDSERREIKSRIEITSRLTQTKFNFIEFAGRSLAARLFYMIHYGDYLSYHLGKMRGVDPTDVSLIEELKRSL